MPNLFGRVAGYFINGWYQALESYQGKREDARTILPAFVGGGPQMGGETMTEERARRLAMMSAWVWSDISLIAGRVSGAMPEVEVYIDGEEVEQHDVVTLLHKPNGLMTGEWFATYVTMWYLLRGNAYAVMVVEAGRVVELLPLPAHRIKPIPESLRRLEDGTLIVDYQYASDFGLERIPGEFVIHWRTVNPDDYWEGLSPLAAALHGMEIDHAQADWVRSFFGDDNAIPAGVVSLPQTTDPVLFDAIKHQFREEFGGRRRTAVVRAGEIDVKVIQQTLEQMQILESREFSRKEIDRAFGVPEGLLDAALSGDSRQAANITFARETVQPLVNHIVAVMSERLRLFYPGLMLEPPNVVPQDRMLEVQEYRTYSLDRTINENREAIGLPPVSHPLADVPVRILQGMIRAGVVSGIEPAAPPGFGVQNPDAMMEEEAGKEADRDAVSAHGVAIDDTGSEHEAWAIELGRWRRVAEKGMRRGDADAWRRFRARYLPADIRMYVAQRMEGVTTPEAVKDVFDEARTLTGRVTYVRDYRPGWNDNVAAAARVWQAVSGGAQ